jgi:hypothetical protein
MHSSTQLFTLVYAHDTSMVRFAHNDLGCPRLIFQDFDRAVKTFPGFEVKQGKVNSTFPFFAPKTIFYTILVRSAVLVHGSHLHRLPIVG